MAVSGRYAYIADANDGLRVIDVANPAAPVEVGIYDTPEYAEDVAVAGQTAYVADRGSGLRVIDVTNPAAPVEVGFYDTPGMPGAWPCRALRLRRRSGSGLRVIDVTNPAAPVEVGSTTRRGTPRVWRWRRASLRRRWEWWAAHPALLRMAACLPAADRAVTETVLDFEPDSTCRPQQRLGGRWRPCPGPRACQELC